MAAKTRMDLLDQIETMLRLEVSTYGTLDYLAPGFQQKLAKLLPESTKHSTDGSSTTAIQASLLPPCMDALKDDISSTSATSGISESWREKICEWCYQVVDHFDFSREVVSISMHYIDRFLSKRVVNKRSFQLVAMAALSLAVKLYEPCKLSMSSMIELSRGYFTVEQMEAMELSLMNVLRWNLHPPTAYGLTKHFLYLLPLPNLYFDIRHDILELSRFLIELSVIDYFFVTHRPSQVAVAAICNAMQDITSVPQDTKHDFHELMFTLNIAVQNDPGIAVARQRLRLLYVQGGYTASVTPQDRLDTTPSPACVSFGTAAYQPSKPEDGQHRMHSHASQHQ